MSEPPTHDPRGDHEQDTGPDAPPVQGPPQGIDPYGDQPDVPDMATPPSPWQAPPPAATPPSRTDTPAPETPPPAINRFQVRSARGPVVLVVVVALIIVAVLVTLAVRSPKQGAQAASPSPSAASSARPATSPATPPTALPDSNTIPVDYEGFKGQWTITKSTWDSTGLNLEVEVKGTSGSLGFSFFALDTDGGSNQYKASGALATGTVTAGGTTTGRVHFNKSHQTTLVILANSYGRQITALTVDA
ncbi:MULTISPECIES: hypothetical protein [Propionibacterium]|uniref:Uncharacterized protein n=4 Tax=Propionibacterium freudenreichii TaxID=1744 RepID=A0A0B7NWD7_PROFF|nr:hypothetical protein [Propionibacterium freudenreichii]AJQ90541.1 Hypothetical protein RM25_0817 [Propionibacterium freudenreichii subsp. freudenreichii]MCT2973663.1 hypothetical protein [Propionibacterium freudenreichii]MCT2976122.1 hypothetical protein [Propionibacterium freudenreichii]MCT2977607.1 hypothetical protein [Propionibacterium freudenreichii]MCT2985308.1 hypothetical protein [Propionibacterium freudenreichii]